MNKKLNVGILIFNEVEVLDFAGPFEVFAITSSIEDNKQLFNTFTISEKDEMIHARNGLLIKANYTFEDCPDVDILIIPGGIGATEIAINNLTLLDWIKNISQKANKVASVCTGAFLLAKSGVLLNGKATTHWYALDTLKKDYPNLEIIDNVKYVDQGKILTSAGISAGIELSLYIVSIYFGINTAKNTAKIMEYDWNLSNKR